MDFAGLLAPAALGFGTGLALIVAIGSQNAFVLRQGIRGEHVAAVVIVCGVSDAVLIAAGIAGVGALLQANPVIVDVVRFAGAAFLVAYGVMAARRAVRPGTLTASGRQPAVGLGAALSTVLALTWLNPHVYLDTVLLLGSVANQQTQDLRWLFGAGAIAASLAWFSALGFGARILRPFFAKPSSWRVLDGFVAVVMLTLGIRLAVGA
ncbi:MULTISPECIES: LysE/ArgO family amino acid transporter [Pseudarthrobacter]|uniref:LysE/ArgO family amino acid transporter n=1 Tax=Pseudarthrobacter TaxID=1742993 RepID=UPI0013DD85A3|nr:MULTISPECIES: LysE/ArgO family amino acid transporter [Pseudarthrobacter]MDP9999314.1 L-lysine exporter family protein LysE/ArgO [Pseudarthrobacter sulfonivorans]